MLFITPSLKTFSSIVDTADVQQNLYFFLLGNKEGRSPKPPVSLTSRIIDNDNTFICSFTVLGGGGLLLSAVLCPGWVLLILIV